MRLPHYSSLIFNLVFMFNKYFIFILCFSLFAYKNCIGKNLLDLSISIDKKFDSQKFIIFLDNGVENTFIPVQFVNNKLLIKKEVIAKFATITIAYQSADSQYRGVRFIIFTNKKSGINFLPTNAIEENRLLKYNLKNGIDEVRCLDYHKMKLFCKKEFDSNIFFSNIYQKIKNDSVLNLYNLSSINLAVKRLEFMKKVKKINDYYTWFFRVNIVNTLKKTHKKELLDFFNQKLNKNYTDSEEGKILREKLEANLYVREGEKAPLFRTIGYSRDSIILEKFKGKYVLIDLWATWCIPCIEKIPTIKKIRNDFDTNLLEIISISYDKDSIAFANGIKKYELNWLHIFNNPKIRNAYGDTPIPALYLINPDGVICYSSWENNIDKIFHVLMKPSK
jgi:thiol-disulfide isomerase/thioredoxin